MYSRQLRTSSLARELLEHTLMKGAQKPMEAIHAYAKRVTGSTMRAFAMLVFIFAGSASFAQVAAPTPGSILKDLERHLPTQPLTAPDGARIDMPEAPALNVASSNIRVTVRSYRFTGNTAYDQNTLQPLVTDRTGDLSLAELNAVADKVTAYYRAHGYPLAQAYLPQQEIQDGMITIAVLEGRYDRIATQNTARISDRRVSRTLQSAMCKAGEHCEGALIDRKPLERGLMLLNDTPGAQAFSTRNAGTNLGYDITGLALSGVDAANYYLASGGFSGTDGIITPRTITATGVVADNRVYDGTTTATLTTTGAVLNGLVLGDSAALDAASYSALFGDKNVGGGKAVSVSGLGLSGADAGNYILTQLTGLTASITPRPLTITAGSNTKYYDASLGAAVVPTVSGSLVGGDTFTLLGERYSTAEVGTGLTLTPIALIADGNGGQNYALTFVNDMTGVIQQNPAAVAEDIGSSSTSGLEDTVAAAGRSDRVRVQGKRDEVCVADDSQNCVVGEASLSTPQVISTGIKLPRGVTTTLDAASGMRW